MKKVLQLFDRILQRFVPDPFVIAIVLTLLTFVLAILFRPHPDEIGITAAAKQTAVFWGGGFWNLAEFTLHMSMILIGGYVVATSRPVKSLLISLIGWIHTPVQAVLFCTFAAIIGSWINWGFGLVIGGIVALEVGRKLPHVPFRVLVASSYSGFLVWHAGLSGSIPLDMNSEGKVFDKLGMELVDVSETLFGTLNLVALASIVVVLPLVNLFCLKLADGDAPLKELTSGLDDTVEAKTDDQENWLNRSVLTVLLLFALAAFYIFVLCEKTCLEGENALKLDLNSINFTFFMVGMLLHGSPRKFIDAVVEAAPKVAPILIQYPLYSAIMAVLKDSGLAVQISNWFVENSTANTFPLMTFYSAGILNLLVPSGGGQWAVQAPIVVAAAQDLGVDIPKVAMAVAWGDAWTNLAQPFWAIPLLTIAGLKIKDIIGFCLIAMLATGLVLSALFLLL